MRKNTKSELGSGRKRHVLPQAVETAASKSALQSSAGLIASERSGAETPAPSSELIQEMQRLKAEVDRLQSSFDASCAALEQEREARRASDEKLDQLLRASMEPPKPGILINTMPKSGSVYIHKHVEAGLGLSHFSIGGGYTLEDHIDFWKAKEFMSGSYLSQNHFAPTPINVQILDRIVGRWVLHIRDPRQAMLSWVHHLDLLKAEGREDALLWVAPAPTESYFFLSLSEKISWNIENYLPQLLHWLMGWLRIYDRGRHNILLTTYDQLIENRERLFERILDFHGIARQRFLLADLPKDRNTHFRKGDPNEWREIFTPDQVRACNAQIPTWILDRFGWHA